jgi:hypothetical protein
MTSAVRNARLGGTSVTFLTVILPQAQQPAGVIHEASFTIAA